MLTIISLTAYSTSFSQASNDSTELKCFTIADAKILLTFARRGKLCDTLSISYEKKIQTLKDIIRNKDSQILLCDEVVREQSTQIDKLNKRNKRNNVLVGILSGISTLELVFLIFL